MEQSAAILTNPLHDSNIGFCADGDGRDGDLHFVLHNRDKIDQLALCPPGLAVAQKNDMLSRRVGALDLAFGFAQGGVKIGLSSGVEPVDLRIENAPKFAHGSQWYSDAKRNIIG